MADVYFAITEEQLNMICDGLRRYFHKVHIGRRRTFSHNSNWYLQDENSCVGHDNEGEELWEYRFVGTETEVKWFRDSFPNLTYDY